MSKAWCRSEGDTTFQTHFAPRSSSYRSEGDTPFSGYMLAGIVSIPASGADADRHGPARPLFRYSSYFLVGTVMAALAPSMPLLVIARLIQGYGGGAMYSLAYGVVPRVYPTHLRPKML